MKSIYQLLVCALLMTSDSLLHAKSAEDHHDSVINTLKKETVCTSLSDISYSCHYQLRAVLIQYEDNECQSSNTVENCKNAGKALLKYLIEREKYQKVANTKQAKKYEQEAKKNEKIKMSKLAVMTEELKEMSYKDYIAFEQDCYGYSKKTEDQRLKCSAKSYDMKKIVMNNETILLRFKLGDEKIKPHVEKICNGPNKEKLQCEVARLAEKNIRDENYKKMSKLKAAYKKGGDVFRKDYNMCRTRIQKLSGTSSPSPSTVINTISSMNKSERDVCKAIRDSARIHGKSVSFENVL